MPLGWDNYNKKEKRKKSSTQNGDHKVMGSTPTFHTHVYIDIDRDRDIYICLFSMYASVHVHIDVKRTLIFSQ